MTAPTFGSLFAGIGGIDLGLERAGFAPLWHSEIDPYACRILAKHWPNTPNIGDIRHVDWERIPTPDLIAGGYPCQPFSTAGARRGADDPRHLWPMFADAVRVLRPRFALLENVAGHLTLGFGQVLGDLAALGYDAEWDCIPAAAVGAPHLRDRVFVIATRQPRMDTDRDGEPTRPFDAWPEPWAPPSVPDTECVGQQTEGWPRITVGPAAASDRETNQPDDARRGWEDEPRVGRVADGVPYRVDRLRTLGNAVVPQVAEHVGRIIAARIAATVPKPAKQYPAGRPGQIDPLTDGARLPTPTRAHSTTSATGPDRTAPQGGRVGRGHQ